VIYQGSDVIFSQKDFCRVVVIGNEIKYPCALSQAIFFSSSNCEGVSIPSATISSPGRAPE
jgi:hypothetical protein